MQVWEVAFCPWILFQVSFKGSACSHRLVGGKLGIACSPGWSRANQDAAAPVPFLAYSGKVHNLVYRGELGNQAVNSDLGQRELPHPESRTSQNRLTLSRLRFPR